MQIADPHKTVMSVEQRLETNLAATSCGESEHNSGSVPPVSVDDDNIGSIATKTCITSQMDITDNGRMMQSQPRSWLEIWSVDNKVCSGR